MGLVGLAGLLISLSAAYFADLRGSRMRLIVFALLLVMHMTAALGAYLYVQGGAISDTVLYYYDDSGLYGRMSGFGTAVILAFVQELKMNIGGSFLDYFMLFQAAGFWGLVIICRIIQEIYEEVGAEPSGWVYLPLFLPGLHFWTAAIGKDAPIFLAVALSVWASMRLSKRLPAIGLALILMVAIRTHIGLIALIALAIAALVGRRTKLWVKALLLAGIAAGAYVIGSNFESTFHFDARNPDALSDYMSAVGAMGEGSGGDALIMQASLPLKALFLWFRPFFVDAENIMGYVASLENLALLIIIGFLTLNFRSVRSLFFKVPYMRFAIVMFAAVTVMLALVNYNVGLGLRQKMMVMPCLLVIFATLLAMRAGQSKQRSETAQLQSQTAHQTFPAPYVGR